MTKTTDTRQLRLMVDGILSSHDIDNLQLSIQLCEAFKKFYASDNARETREEILAGLMRGSTKTEEVESISTEINKRTGIRPVTPAWIDFINFAWKEAKQGKTITLFLDWWLADEWQRTHPPAKPDTWFVKWDLAFTSAAPADAYQDVAR